MKVEYRKFAITQVSGTPERWLVIFEGEFFHFPSLEKAQEFVDFVAGKPVNYNSNLTC